MEKSCVALWRAVLERVFLDAFHDLSETSYDVRKSDPRDEAIDYVCSRCKNFKQLCWRCELDPDWVYDQFMMRLALDD